MRLIIALAVLAAAGVAAFFMWPTIDALLPKPTQSACTAEARACPDGSAVGRTGPNCEFAACSGVLQSIATTTYQCNGGKTIQAAVFEGTTTPPAGPDQPPTPGGSANVVLSDGRTMMLQKTISADGVRYSNGDPSAQRSETFVFWSKGYGALVLENDQEKNYTGCVTATSSQQ